MSNLLCRAGPSCRPRISHSLSASARGYAEAVSKQGFRLKGKGDNEGEKKFDARAPVSVHLRVYIARSLECSYKLFHSF
jgi:hypothetical protein